MQYGLVGEKLGHSFSPELHAMIGGYPYEICEMPREELADFFRRREFSGVNVTIPYKSAVIPYLDELSPAARRIGAVNTVVKRAGRLIGYNTDYDGMRYLLASAGISLAGKKVLILGAGGTSKTALAVAQDAGAREVLRVSRTPREAGVIDYAAAKDAHADAEVLIDTTSVGMYPAVSGVPLCIDDLPALTGAIGAVYRPLRSTLIEQARDRGIPAAGGLAMLVAQGVRASELFLDTKYPERLTRELVARIVREKSHLILIGMPAVGKSTVGKLLAKITGRAFFDTDAEIVRQAGCDIPTLFETRGEAAFRALETRVVEELAYGQVGAVIATGGGVPLSEENRMALRRTGQVFWLDRPLSELTPTEDRPLARSAEALRALYAAREPIYRATADKRIEGQRAPEETANLILEAFT